MQLNKFNKSKGLSEMLNRYAIKQIPAWFDCYNNLSPTAKKMSQASYEILKKISPEVYY
jgi:hypothetical protein